MRDTRIPPIDSFFQSARKMKAPETCSISGGLRWLRGPAKRRWLGARASQARPGRAAGLAAQDPAAPHGGVEATGATILTEPPVGVKLRRLDS